MILFFSFLAFLVLMINEIFLLLILPLCFFIDLWTMRTFGQTGICVLFLILVYRLILGKRWRLR